MPFDFILLKYHWIAYQNQQCQLFLQNWNKSYCDIVVKTIKVPFYFIFFLCTWNIRHWLSRISLCLEVWNWTKDYWRKLAVLIVIHSKDYQLSWVVSQVVSQQCGVQTTKSSIYKVVEISEYLSHNTEVPEKKQIHLVGILIKAIDSILKFACPCFHACEL